MREVRWAGWMVVAGFACVLGAGEKTKYYDVKGATTAELRESLNRERPVGPDRQPHDATTVWNIRWRYTTGRSGSACGVASFDVSLDVVTTVPKWVNEADAPSALVERWRTYYAALLAHE